MKTSTFLRLGRWAALTATAVATTILVAPAAASAATATVQTAGGALTVRAGNSTGYDAWTSLANGASVTILCQLPGQSITGTHGTSVIWSFLSNGGTVPNTYLSSGTTGYVAKRCGYSALPSRANPHGLDTAVSWEFSHYGSTAYEGSCMNFQAQAFGWSHSGWSTAEVGGDYMVSHSLMHGGVPPRGALVWYHNSSGTGHVVVSLGEGKIVGTSVGGRVAVGAYTFHNQYRGWSVPYFPSGS